MEAAEDAAERWNGDETVRGTRLQQVHTHTSTRPKRRRVTGKALAVSDEQTDPDEGSRFARVVPTHHSSRLHG